MRSALSLSSLLAGLVLCCATCRAEDGRGVVSGRVVDRQGRPVAGAEVWAVTIVKFQRERVATARTDADGRFRLEAVPDAAPVDVWAEAETVGLARERREDVRVIAGGDRDIGTLSLVPGTRLTGRILDAEGRPVPNATGKLELFRRVLGHTIDSHQTEWNVYADTDGRFETVPLPPGEASFAWGAPGKVRTGAGQRVVPGVDRVDLGDITLPDETPTRGRIVDQDGSPAPGVEVYADYDYDNAVKTDADGRFTLGGVGPKAKQLLLQSNDYFTPKPFDIVEPRDDLRLTVQKAYTIEGTAVDAETGQLVPIESVRLCTVERDADGTVRLLG